MAAQIAQRMDEFGQVVVSAIQGAIQGSNPSTTATTGQVAGLSNLAPPHTRMPEPSLIHTRQFGPPKPFVTLFCIPFINWLQQVYFM
jgi:hypothetical protein